MFLLATLATVVVSALGFYFCVIRPRKRFLTDLGSKAVVITGKVVTVVITGCDFGFAHDAALSLSDVGVTVFAGCLSHDGMARLNEKRPASKKLVPIRMDVRSEASIARALGDVTKHLEKNPTVKLWGLINNAAIEPYEGPDDLYTVSSYTETLDVNLFGCIRFVHAFRPFLEDSTKLAQRSCRGRIAIVTSIKGRLVFHENGPYAVSKYGLEAYGDTLRRELGPQGFDVSIIQPGGYRTNIMAGVGTRFKAQWEAAPQRVRDKYGEAWFRKRYEFWNKVLDVFQVEDSSPVIDAYVHSMVGNSPKTHYIVGKDAWMYYLVSLLPAPLQDWYLARLFGALWGPTH